MKSVFLAAIAALCIQNAAFAQTKSLLPPEPTDLLAAYCIGFLQILQRGSKTVDNYLGEATPETLATIARLRGENTEALQRLQGYLAPRLQFIDATGVAAAQSQATRDAQAASAAVQKCQCSTVECIDACPAVPGLAAKQARCRRPHEFLPY